MERSDNTHDINKKHPSIHRKVCIFTVIASVLIALTVIIGFVVWFFVPIRPHRIAAQEITTNVIPPVQSTKPHETLAEHQLLDVTVTSTAEMSSTLPTSTKAGFTRPYPAISPIHRVPHADLPEMTFDIVSSRVKMTLKNSGSNLSPGYSHVYYELTAKNESMTCHLRCAVHSIDNITVKASNGVLLDSVYKYDVESQMLTITIPPVTARNSSVMIQISYVPSALERISFPCGSKTCAVYLYRQTSRLIPHFDDSLKQKWSIEVTHPKNVQVLTNSRKNQNYSSSQSSIFHETSPLLPGEISFVFIENFVNHASGDKVEIYSTNDTNAEELTDLVEKINNQIKYFRKSSMVVIPAMQNYEFIGSHGVLVGTDLLRSNEVIKLEFVWNCIYKMNIYERVISSDRNPIWMYEQSSLFIATYMMSSNKEAWKKYLYELAMDSGSSVMEEPSNMSMRYQDEERYLKKPEHMAKLSTVLGMLVRVRSSGVLLNGGLHLQRNDSLSSQYFFFTKELILENGESLNVEKVTSCYMDNPGIPRVRISRTNKSHVVIQRAGIMIQESCDIHLWLVKVDNTTNSTNNEHNMLNGKIRNIVVKSEFPVLLSGNSPTSAYGYTMDQSEFDRLIDDLIDKGSYDNSCLNLLASNVVRAAAEGKLKYDSVKRYLKKALAREAVSVDAVVDWWMWTVSLSRNDSLTNLMKPIVADVLNVTGLKSKSDNVTTYIVNRFQTSLQNLTLFEIEKAKKLVHLCGTACYKKIHYWGNVSCVYGEDKDCPYDPHILDVFVCKDIKELDIFEYGKFLDLYVNCVGKPCFLHVVRGLLCSKNVIQLESWVKATATLDVTDLVNRQVILEIFKGLVSNDVYKPLMFPYLMDNWHVLYGRYSGYPTLLGDIVQTLTSMIVTQEELDQLKHFVAFHGASLDMFREFKEQIQKAEKAIEWNKKFSQVFSQLFQ